MIIRYWKEENGERFTVAVVGCSKIEFGTTRDPDALLIECLTGDYITVKRDDVINITG